MNGLACANSSAHVSYFPGFLFDLDLFGADEDRLVAGRDRGETSGFGVVPDFLPTTNDPSRRGWDSEFISKPFPSSGKIHITLDPAER